MERLREEKIIKNKIIDSFLEELNKTLNFSERSLSENTKKIQKIQFSIQGIKIKLQENLQKVSIGNNINLSEVEILLKNNNIFEQLKFHLSNIEEKINKLNEIKNCLELQDVVVSTKKAPHLITLTGKPNNTIFSLELKKKRGRPRVNQKKNSQKFKVQQSIHIQ